MFNKKQRARIRFRLGIEDGIEYFKKSGRNIGQAKKLIEGYKYSDIPWSRGYAKGVEMFLKWYEGWRARNGRV